MNSKQALTHFEKYLLALPIPDLQLPALPIEDEVGLWERAWIIGYGCHVPRGEENLRLLSIAVGSLPGSAEEVRDLELAGF